MELLNRLDNWLALITLVAVGWYLGVRPLGERFGWWSALRRFLSSVSVAPAAPYVAPAPAPEPAPPADRGLSAGLSAPAPAVPEPLRAIMIDSEADKAERQAATTRPALIRALVAAGWRTGEIRTLLRGDTTAVTDEIRAARIALGVAEEDAPRTPLAGRPIPPGVEFEERV